jgi:hypothetical protein
MAIKITNLEALLGIDSITLGFLFTFAQKLVETHDDNIILPGWT